MLKLEQILNGENEMNAVDKVKNLIEQDGGKVIRADIYGDVIVLVATHSSIPQIKRFKDIGEKMGMFEDSDIEIKDKGIVFSAALKIN